MRVEVMTGDSQDDFAKVRVDTYRQAETLPSCQLLVSPDAKLHIFLSTSIWPTQQSSSHDALPGGS